MKECKGCGKTQPLENFHRHAKGVMGRHSKCKPCRSKIKKSYLAGLTIGEREKRKVYLKKWKERNTNHVSEYAKEHYKNNREKYRFSNKKSRSKNRKKWDGLEKEEYLRRKRESKKRSSTNLTTGYLNKQIYKASGGILLAEDIPPELIELTRLQITIHRIIKQKSND